MDNKKYVIITLADYTSDELQELIDNSLNTSISHLRVSIDGTKGVLKWRGDTPAVFDGMTIYNQNEILAILKTSDWIEL